MINFRYATDTSSWEPWQLEYKYGALYVFPPTGIIEAIDLLRKTYDPKSASICQTHISLSEPLKAPPTEADLEELKTQLSGVEPFEVHFGPLRSFPPYPGVTYVITPEDKFKKLRLAIHLTSLFKGIILKRKHTATHITIAEFITLKKTTELLKGLNGKVPEGTFLCDGIEYAIPNNNFYFERVLKIPLG